jgi:tRNA pseudouridine55 synthase
MDGLLLVDKPSGPTSHDIVARVRRLLGEPRVGHTGTLDPMASGLLPLVIGRATRLARFLSASDKSYHADVRLGVATDTYDAQGAATTAPHQGPMPSWQDLERALDRFRGAFLQQPPAYSAKKIDGARSYRLARASSRAPSTGAPVLPARVEVTAHAIEVLAADGDRVTLRVDCSAGFYVRALAHDLGTALGTGAHLAALRRTRSGGFLVSRALAFDAIERDPDAAGAAVIPLAAMLPDLSAAVLTDAGAHRVAHGRDLGPGDVVELNGGPTTGIRLVDRSGRLLGIGVRAGASGVLHPSVVLM